MRPWLLPVMLLLALSSCVDDVLDQSMLALQVASRYGATSTAWHSSGASTRLDLVLTDHRWNGTNPVFPDSARAVARFALSQLEAGRRPDSISVTIRTTDRGFFLFRTTGSSTAVYSAAEL